MITTSVLLVEDDAFLREIYNDTLTRAGFQVDTAEDGVQALQKINMGNWDILLLDILLPRLDGIEVIKKLRTDPEYVNQAKKPVIFLTNMDNPEEQQQALAYAQGYMIKSKIDPKELVTKIQQILQIPQQ